MLPAAATELWARVRQATVRLGSLVTSTGSSDGWTFEVVHDTEVRWSRDSETITCFRFDDGYVATVTYAARDTTWQLTPGPAPLGSALASTVLYRDYAVPPQLDPSGRPFVALSTSGPRHVFEEFADEQVEYRYLDGIRTLDEFPSCLDVCPDVEQAFDHLSSVTAPTQFGE